MNENRNNNGAAGGIGFCRRLPATLGHLPAGRPLQERRPSS